MSVSISDNLLLKLSVICYMTCGERLFVTCHTGVCAPILFWLMTCGREVIYLLFNDVPCSYCWYRFNLFASKSKHKFGVVSMMRFLLFMTLHQ